ncbi:5-formyltetrahydrofolate cyclo-ligase [Thalassotalea sediminis]|uniref:5-formyltetrahydrofolate cyclo-ligase n=1 Tax=Thalassotalea sediminis TaxID=1759089 RepID=UPI0025738491|nr:5-formyltetrahydrofolate cyclo-ligase [Thalassotalea sediminis]
MKAQNSRQQIRQQVRQKRQSLSRDLQTQASFALVKQLIKLPTITDAKSIAIYLANDGELNTTAFIEWCWQHNIQTYLPVLHPFNAGHLLFLQYHPDTVMTKNKYGIKEPKLDVRNVCAMHELDVIFTPLVAFDESGARLGMGGGYYDRTLATRSASKPVAIGLAHDCQKIARIPIEAWDIPLPHIITPSQHYQFTLTTN